MIFFIEIKTKGTLFYLKIFTMSVSAIPVKSTFFNSFKHVSWVKSFVSDFDPVNQNQLKEKNLLLQIEVAKSHGKLSEGLREAWITALKKKGKLLIAEKDVLFPQKSGKKYNRLLETGFIKNSSIEAEKLVDDTVVKVLEEGGSIEFVENNFLKNFKRMVVIEAD